MKNRYMKGSIGLLLTLAFIGVGFMITQHTSSERLEDKCEKSFQQYKSSKDMDNDGIDDQTDILEGALNYIAKEPIYKSKYYSDTGYPNDNYGVCTDVVAFALLNAGYDLKTLVEQDIAEYEKEYAIMEPDENIDFRRVKNLNIYFQHNAILLTTDITETEQWQGGDIVVFEKHIGIVSDRRNEKGIPYVIHHNSLMQKRYEEDILEKREDIVGHYRVLGTVETKDSITSKMFHVKH